MAESHDSIILQIKIEESAAGKNTEKTKTEVDALATSIVGLAKANKQLRDERNKLDTSTVEGSKRIQELNKLIDENNDLIKQNSSNLEKQRMNVGNYKRGITDALKEVRIGGINVGDVVDKLSKANEDLFQGMIQGYKQSGIQAKLFGTTARTALTLTGIGIFLVALGTMVAYWDDIAEAIGLADSKQKKFLDNARKELDDQNVLLERRLQLMELWGASQGDMNKLTIPNLQEQIRLNNIEIAQIDEQIRKMKLRKGILADTDEEVARQEELRKLNKSLSDQITFLLSKEQKEIADANERKIKEDQAAAEKLKAQREKDVSDKEKKTQDQYNKEAAAFREANERKKEEQQFINDELKAIDEEEFNRREERVQIVTDQQKEQHRLELEAQQKQNKDLGELYIEDANAKRDAALRKLDAQKAVADAEIGLAAQIGSTLGQLAGKNKALSIASIVIEKAAAIAGIISNTAIANAKAIAASPLTFGMPWVGINTGTAIAAGVSVAAQAATSIADITGAKFALGGEFKPRKYAYGGLIVGGRSHSEGGTKYVGQDGNKFEVERGEGIYILKRSAQAELNYLSTLNQKHGGRSFGQKTWYAAQGGQIETRDISSRSQQNTSIARMIAASFANMPRPVVYVEAIRSGIDTVVDIENSAAPLNI